MDQRARAENFFAGFFWLCCRESLMMLAVIALDAGPSLQTRLSVLAMFLMVAYG
jgi:hypothetical protein